MTIDSIERKQSGLASVSLPAVLLRLEGLALLVVAVTLYIHLRGSGLLFALLLFAPDLAMLGYLVNTRVGALAYNAVHFFTLPLALGLLATAAGWHTGSLLALIWLAHIGMDRTLGYGLKYATAFKDTHLGRV